ncbi:MAG: alpha/beta fold hydrolase [Minisyncoccia bacterium]
MSKEEKEIILNKLLIRLYSLKPKEKPKNWVILLHGWGVSSSIFNSLAEFLTENNFGIYLFDFPGFGKSPSPKTPLKLDDYVGIIKELIEKEIKENIILLGHSFGGRVAIKFSAQYPDLVKKLILIDSAGFVKRGLKAYLIKNFSKIFKPIFKLPCFSSLRIKIYRKLGSEDYLSNPELQKTYAKIVSEDLTKSIQQVSLPTLIIWGKSDRVTPLNWGKKIHQLINNSKFYEINGGHFSFLDNPAECHLIIKNFLS